VRSSDISFFLPLHVRISCIFSRHARIEMNRIKQQVQDGCAP
jgi:hypothetical protein